MADTVYVIDPHAALQDRVEQIESFDFHVVGAESTDMDRAADGILQSDPTMVVAFLSHGVEDIRNLFLKVRTRGPEAEIPFVFVDGTEAAVARLRQVAPAGEYTDVYHLRPVMEQTVRTAKRMRKAT